MQRLKVLLRYIRWQFVLHKEEDEEVTIREIKEGVAFKGYNLWILSAAMIIASIGLNVDSPTAIIGAMLMSPLMGPAIGFAFGMAVQDIDLKKSCFTNWLLMTVTSLFASTVYFFFSPFDLDTSALASYKEATIFDISLAFFGGIAGFLGINRRDGSKIIAGVAVATACMPPLCTASFGIAHGEWDFFVGGIYFYLINTLFIGLGTFLIARYLRRHRSMMVSHQSRTSQLLWSILIVLMVVPGVIIAVKRWKVQHEAVLTASSVSPDKERINKLEKQVRALDSLVHVLAKHDAGDVLPRQ